MLNLSVPLNDLQIINCVTRQKEFGSREFYPFINQILASLETGGEEFIPNVEMDTFLANPVEPERAATVTDSIVDLKLTDSDLAWPHDPW